MAWYREAEMWIGQYRWTLSFTVSQGSENTFGDWKVLAGNQFHDWHLGGGLWKSGHLTDLQTEYLVVIAYSALSCIDGVCRCVLCVTVQSSESTFFSLG
jgi:hypothetical protein